MTPAWPARGWLRHSVGDKKQHQPLPCTSFGAHYYATTHQITARQIKVACLFWVATAVHEDGGGLWVVGDSGGGWWVVVGGGGASLLGGRCRQAALTCDSPVFSWRCSRCTKQAASLLSHTGNGASPALHSPGLTLSRLPLSFSLFLAHSVSCSGWLAPRCRFSKWRKDGTSTLFYLFSTGTSVLGPFAEI